MSRENRCEPKAVTNEELVRAFRAAKRRIQQGKDEFICHAIDGSKLIRQHVRNVGVGLIQGRLGERNCTWESWLASRRRYAYGKLCKLPLDERDEAGKQARLAWLDSLISEFSSGEAT